jgi:hypothetical protein
MGMGVVVSRASPVTPEFARAGAWGGLALQVLWILGKHHILIFGVVFTNIRFDMKIISRIYEYQRTRLNLPCLTGTRQANEEVWH